MHELALAEGVIQTTLSRARDAGRPVRRVVARLGELQQLDAEVFQACLEAVRPVDEPLLADVAVDLQVEPARLRCHRCHRDFGLADLERPPDADELEAIHFVPELARSYLRCPDCHSPDFEVVAGRGVWIESIDIEPAPPEAP